MSESCSLNPETHFGISKTPPAVRKNVFVGFRVANMRKKKLRASSMRIWVSPLLLKFLGGVEREAVPTSGGFIELDASESYDPDEQKFNSSSLSFSWLCSSVRECLNVTFERSNASVVKVDVTKLSVNTRFTMTVTVKANSIEASANQTITIADSNAPITTIM